ncbi:unnamed protein product [Pseudo-nitzschia multistriata]|uniref:SET domain-containing protein n=1 Tax=Pseudo-nitzschia multistriata TaxID=183589 RepID=A0A448Z682_9STRA|nr:unnamed protein product [Pseudo-nitzschia multistriata]
MRTNVVQVQRPLKFYLVFFSLIAVLVACFTPSHAQQKNGNGSSGKGFGRKISERAGAGADTTPEGRYLDAFGLKLEDGKNGDRNVRSLVDRSPGEILLAIPSEEIITVERIRSRLTASCETKRDDNRPHEDEEEGLAIGLLRLKYDALDPYVSNVLPKKHFNAWTMSRDLWMETSAVLPRCYLETFDATRQRVNRFATETAAAADHKFTVEDALWAFSMVRSRSLAVPELNDDDSGKSDRMPLALIPGLDLLNHKFGVGTQLQLVAGEGISESKWLLSTSDSISAGDEVFLSYGDDKDNWKLLLTYGFAIPNNPNAVVFWTWSDLLDAAQTVRPDTFSDRVCRQLLRHPQLEAYTVPSEHRATFSYDAHTGTPRESLSNGLAMLNNLAAQLGKPEADNDALSTEVLEALISRRLEELREGLKLLTEQREKRSEATDKQEEYAEWESFFSSLLFALKSEEQQLQTQH